MVSFTGFRFLAAKYSTERLQKSSSRQDAKAQRKKSFFSELGVLCVLARVILPPFP
jgi:hypothetical protein